MMSKNHFEFYSDHVLISKDGWDFVASATIRDDYKDELMSVTWGLSADRYLYNKKLGYLHIYIMQKWYGMEEYNEMKKNHFVVDHIDNDSHNCCIENLAFLSEDWNKAKGMTLDKDSQDKRYIALTIYKDFATQLMQITVFFNREARLEEVEGLEKPAVVRLAFLLYDDDYHRVIIDALAILNDYEKEDAFYPNRLHWIDFDIEGYYGSPCSKDIFDRYLNGELGPVALFQRKSPLRNWTEDNRKEFLYISRH